MAGYIGSTPVPQATQHRETFTATNGQTSFATVGYTPQFLDVYLNGVKLAPADFTATNGSDIILASGAATNDILEVVAYTPFEVANQTFTGTTTAANLSVTGNATFGDNNKAIFGAGSDLQIYHDGSNSFISDQGTGNLKILADDFRIRNATDTDSYIFVNSGAEVGLTYNGATKLTTTATGISVTGNATFADNGKAIFGSGNDLSIFHNGTSSLIEDNGTGGITLRSDIFTVQNAAGTETVAQFVQDGFVKLFHNNSQVLTTTSSGASITGSLGIGTSTPRTGLHLYGAGQTTSAISDVGSLGAFLRVSDTGAAGGAGGGVIFGTNASEADGFAGFAAIKGLLANGNDRTVGALAFSTRASTTDTALTERMRLTSDGNLLVGKTSVNATDIGIVANANGRLYTAVDGNSNVFNRTTSDGDILNFRKDGSTVGSIGNSGTQLTVESSSNLVLQADSGASSVITQGALRPLIDNVDDLGVSNRRFQDLYLSGGVYLGGTVAANKLDDYEEGTWTPDLRFSGGATGITYSQTPQGEYTKIGNMVVARGEIRLSSKGSSTGSLRIYGLPFTSSIVVDWEGGFVTNWANLRGIYSKPVLNISTGVTHCSLRAASVGVVTGAEFNDPSMTNANIDNDFILGFTLNYRTA